MTNIHSIMCDNVHSINVCKHSILHVTDSPIFGQEVLVAKPKPKCIAPSLLSLLD